MYSLQNSSVIEQNSILVAGHTFRQNRAYIYIHIFIICFIVRGLETKLEQMTFLLFAHILKFHFHVINLFSAHQF